MLTVPAPTPVTIPVDDTVASAVLDDVHVAVLVTSCVVPFDIVAVATNWDVAPTAGVVPVTAMDDTVEGAVDDPHATAPTTSGSASAIEITRRICMLFSSSWFLHLSRASAGLFLVRPIGCDRTPAAL
jgi:hypothetical protein